MALEGKVRASDDGNESDQVEKRGSGDDDSDNNADDGEGNNDARTDLQRRPCRCGGSPRSWSGRAMLRVIREQDGRSSDGMWGAEGVMMACEKEGGRGGRSAER